MAVNAYLLPEKFDNQPTTIKTLSPKKVVWGVETDLTGGMVSNTAGLYNEYADVIDFMSVRGSQQATYIDDVSFKLENVDLLKLPPELIGSFTADDWFRIYINGVLYKSNFYTYTFDASTKEITFVFDGLPFVIESTDEIGVTGKFIEL
jgi:hypothetical protein